MSTATDTQPLAAKAKTYVRVMPPTEAVARLTLDGVPLAEAEAAVAAAIEPTASPAGKFAGVCASDVKARKLDWLWKPWLPLGSLTVLYGEEGLGKGTVAADVAARATLGALDSGHGEGVEWITFEDAADDVIVPRLLAAGADLDRVTIHEAGEDFGSPLVLPDDVEALAAAMVGRGSKLLVIDPLSDSLREGLRDNNNGDVRKGLIPLQEMARRHRIAILGLLHPNKGASRAADKVMGSKAWRSVPRSVVLLSRDPADDNGPTRVLCLSKSNGAGTKPSLMARIEGVDVTHPAQGALGSQPRLVLEGDSEWTDSDLVIFTATGKVPGASKPDTKEAQAAEIILKLLEGTVGDLPAEVAYRAGKAADISEETMRRARRGLGIESEGHHWTVPEGWTCPLKFA